MSLLRTELHQKQASFIKHLNELYLDFEEKSLLEQIIINMQIIEWCIDNSNVIKATHFFYYLQNKVIILTQEVNTRLKTCVEPSVCAALLDLEIVLNSCKECFKFAILKNV